MKILDQFRVALLSYATSQPALRIYSSSKSRWVDFHEGLQKLMTDCVSQGTGGAYLVPRKPLPSLPFPHSPTSHINIPSPRSNNRDSPLPATPGLKQSTLVVYAYAIGSKFDFQMNYYMSTPYGIDPSAIGTDLEAGNSSIPSSILSLSNSVATAPVAAHQVAVNEDLG